MTWCWFVAACCGCIVVITDSLFYLGIHSTHKAFVDDDANGMRLHKHRRMRVYFHIDQWHVRIYVCVCYSDKKLCMLLSKLSSVMCCHIVLLIGTFNIYVYINRHSDTQKRYTLACLICANFQAFMWDGKRITKEIPLGKLGDLSYLCAGFGLQGIGRVYSESMLDVQMGKYFDFYLVWCENQLRGSPYIVLYIILTSNSIYYSKLYIITSEFIFLLFFL